MRFIAVLVFLLLPLLSFSQQKIIYKVSGRDTITIIKPFPTDTFTKDGMTFTYVDQMPEFPADWKKYITEHLKYTPNKNISGKVFCRFIILKDGSIDNIQVVKSLTPDYDSAAVRLIRNMPRWKPGKNDGNPVDVWFVLPVNFN